MLTPEMLKILCEMGHDDEIVIADAHFPQKRWESVLFSTLVLVHGDGGSHCESYAVRHVCKGSDHGDEPGAVGYR